MSALLPQAPAVRTACCIYCAAVYFVRVPAFGRACISQMGLCKVCAHEPEELLKALDMVLDNIRADDVKAVKLSDSFAVVLDEPLIICDQGFKVYRSVL